MSHQKVSRCFIQYSVHFFLRDVGRWPILLVLVNGVPGCGTAIWKRDSRVLFLAAVALLMR
ncbi:MAG: hypothetical protein ACI9ZF_001519 [Bradyrhizobium sp.]|jgi:hypothetical protein